MALANKVIYQAGAIREFEKPEVCEAIKVANANRWTVALSPTEWVEREARLKKEYEERSNAPVPGKEQQEEKIRIICCSASPKADFYYKHFLNEGNPALKESASQFNDALLDEQAKEIERLKEKNLRLGREIARLNKNIYKKNMKIEELRKESSRHLRGKIKMFGENVDLEQMLKDKDAVLADVAEELRLSKIREKNLTEVSQKHMKENEELKKELDVAKKQNTAVMTDMTAKCFRAARESINDVFESYAAKYAKSTLDDLKDKAYESFNAKACNLGLVGSKNGNGIFDQMIGVDIAEEGGDHSAIIARCCKNIAISKDEAEIIERCTKDGTELHYSEKNGFTYTNMFGDEMPIICLRGMCQVFTDEEIKNMKK